MNELTPRPVVLASLRVGKPRPWAELVADAADAPGLPTGVAKRPVASAWLGAEGLEGDGQGNRRVHGGPDKAVCAYPGEHYLAWRAELAMEGASPGAMGENFSLNGADETAFCIGDRWRVGAAVVEVSQPRQPCATIARLHRRIDLPKWVVKSRRTGWYFRVVEEGEVASGEPLELLDRPSPEWTIDRVNTVTLHEKGASDAARELAALPRLSEEWRMQLTRRL